MLHGGPLRSTLPEFLAAEDAERRARGEPPAAVSYAQVDVDGT